MIYPCLGSIQNTRSCHLLNAKTVKGEDVLKLGPDKDGKIENKDQVLVMRDQVDGKAIWRPVKNVDELNTFLTTAPAADRGTKLGLWQDKRQFLILPRDGKIQDNEVKPLSERWNTERFHHLETIPFPKSNLPQYEGYFYAKPAADKVHIGTEETPAGTIHTFNEPLATSRVRVDETLSYAADGNSSVGIGHMKSYEYKPD